MSVGLMTVPAGGAALRCPLGSLGSLLELSPHALGDSRRVKIPIIDQDHAMKTALEKACAVAHSSNPSILEDLTGGSAMNSLVKPRVKRAGKVTHRRKEEGKRKENSSYSEPEKVAHTCNPSYLGG